MKSMHVSFLLILTVTGAYSGLIGAPIATSFVATRQLSLGPTPIASLGAPLISRSVIAAPAIAAPGIGLGGYGLGGSGLGGYGSGGYGSGGYGLGGYGLGKPLIG